MHTFRYLPRLVKGPEKEDSETSSPNALELQHTQVIALSNQPIKSPFANKTRQSRKIITIIPKYREAISTVKYVQLIGRLLLLLF